MRAIAKGVAIVGSIAYWISVAWAVKDTTDTLLVVFVLLAAILYACCLVILNNSWGYLPDPTAKRQDKIEALVDMAGELLRDRLNELNDDELTELFNGEMMKVDVRE